MIVHRIASFIICKLYFTILSKSNKNNENVLEVKRKAFLRSLLHIGNSQHGNFDRVLQYELSLLDLLLAI